VSELYKPGDRVVVLSPEEMSERPAWGDLLARSAGTVGTIREWCYPWRCWWVDMDDGSVARYQTAYLKPLIETIADVERFLSAS